MTVEKDVSPMSMKAIDGMNMLAQAYSEEQGRISDAFARGEELFSLSPEGIHESTLVQQGSTRPEASASVDELRSNGSAVKNWQNGWLSHVI